MSFTKRQITTGLKRLLVLAGILDKADAEHRRKKEPTYLQTQVVHWCGTPACAGGHWDYSKPGVALARRGARQPGRLKAFIDSNGHWTSALRWVDEVFFLTYKQDEDIFGFRGCDGARTAKEAAKYIRNFVKQQRSAK